MHRRRWMPLIRTWCRTHRFWDPQLPHSPAVAAAVNLELALLLELGLGLLVLLGLVDGRFI